MTFPQFVKHDIYSRPANIKGQNKRSLKAAQAMSPFYEYPH